MKRFVLGFLLLCCCGTLQAAEYRAGVGRVVITPHTPMPMAGYAIRTHPSEGVIQDIWAKALVVEDGRGGRVVILTADLIGVPREIADEVAARLKQKHGIQRQQIVVNASHTHSGPIVWPSIPILLPSDPAEQERTKRYARQLTDDMVRVVELALAGLAPAEISVGHGSAGFTINRRQPTPRGVVIGVNPKAPVDDDVPVLKIASPEGKLRAVLFGYACHNTTLGGDFYKFNGDYAGFAQAELEKALPGTTAMFMQLCGGDQNPNPRGKLEQAETYGRTLAGEVRRVLSGELQPVSGPIRTAYRLVKLDFAPQSRDTFVEEAKSSDRFRKARAELMLKAIDAGHSVRQIDCPVQAVRWGRQLALLALGGEPVVDYALRLKRENPRENLIVAGYCNDVMCYIPTRRILHEGGYEPVTSMIYYGHPGPLADSVEEILIAACREALQETAMVAGVGQAATFHVAQTAPKATDAGPGSEAIPWKTIGRAAAAKELRPGDTVLIGAGVYREDVQIKVSGEPGKPITFAAAPGARVVLKGSEIVAGPWTRLAGHTSRKEPYPKAFADVWKVPLGEAFFTDARFQGCYQDKARRWVSQVFIDENRPLQRIGLDPIYKNEEYLKLTTVGRGFDDLIQDSFYFDPAEQTLYVKMQGDPGWFSIEVGVRGFVLTVEKQHDLVIRGLEMRHNRQPGGQWPMVSIGDCQRVTVEDCKVYQSDFCGLGLGGSKDCTIRRCDLSYNGNTGLGMGGCTDCTIDGCTLLWNNYRRFFAGWHSGGMKCIPGNQRCTIRGCEAAHNVASDGIWFDTDNADIRILGNVCHHNGASGIFFEANKGGGIIADNLVYANRGRGIYISRSQNTWVVHNTVAGNDCGIVAMPGGDDWPCLNVHVLNNLLVGNYIAAATVTRGCDLTLYMGADAAPFHRTVTSNHSDYNVFANTSWTPTMRQSWNPDNTLAQWRERFGEDEHSTLAPVAVEQRGDGFLLKSTAGLGPLSPLPDKVRAAIGSLPHGGCRRTERK